MLDPEIAELRCQIADHPAGHLVLVMEGIVLGDAPPRLPLPVRDPREIGRLLVEHGVVERHPVPLAP